MRDEDEESHPPAEERRPLTVLVCDLVGSATLPSKLHPEDLKNVLKKFLGAATAAVARYNGYVAKLLGDGLMAFFGYPNANEADAQHAVQAGLAIVDALRGVNRDVEPVYGIRLEVRVGIHSDVWIVAYAGGGPDVFGDLPNIASRVQGAAAPDTVFITEATYRLVEGRFDVESRGAPALKNVQKPVMLYEVAQSSGVASRFDAASTRGLTPFVGRKRDLQLLVELWEEAQAGRGRVVFVTGEPGIGKSRLVRMLKLHLAGTAHEWIECHGSQLHQSSPFHAVVEMLRQRLPAGPSASSDVHTADLEQSLARAGVSDPEAVELVAPLLGLDVRDDYPPARRQKLLEILAAWLMGLARVKPMVVVVEDYHWVDPSTDALLVLLKERVARGPVLLVHTTRSELGDRPRPSHHALIALNRLSEEEVRAVITNVASPSVVAEAAIASIMARADGVPLFAEELTKNELEGMSRDDRSVPATLSAALQARLDRLGPAAKEVAQLASAFGRFCPYTYLRALSRLADDELHHALGLLTDAGLGYALGAPPEATYVFWHALAADAAYASLLEEPRHKLHRKIAALLARLKDDVAAPPEIIGHHYAEAGEIQVAVGYYCQAGMRASARSAHQEAGVHLRTAMDLLHTLPGGEDRDATESDIQFLLGGSYAALQGFGHSDVEAAFTRVGELVSGPRLGFAQVGLAFFYSTRGEVKRALELADRVRAHAIQIDDKQLELHGHLQVAICEHYQGKFQSVLGHCDRTLRLYERGQHHAVVSMLAGDPGVVAYSYRAWAQWQIGRPERACEDSRAAIALAEELEDPFSLALALFFTTALDWLAHDLPTWRDRAARVIELSEKNGFQLWLALGKTFLGAARVAAREKEAIADVVAGLDLTAATGNRAAAPVLLALLGESYMAASQLPAARDQLELALQIAEGTGQSMWDAEIHRLLGELTLRSDQDPADAERSFHRAIEIAGDQGAKSFELRAVTSLARLLRDRGKHADAREQLQPVLDSFTEGFETPDYLDAKALLATLSAGGRRTEPQPSSGVTPGRRRKA